MLYSNKIPSTDIATLCTSQLYFDAAGCIPNLNLSIKLEGLNPAGSIKNKTAWYLLNGLEHRGEITPGRSTIVESSSGNLGIALAMLCNQRGYSFICVVDPTTAEHCKRMIRMYGGRIEEVTERDEERGYLPARIQRVNELVEDNPGFVWTNQYANPDNARAHYETTGPEILSASPGIEVVFIGSSTTGRRCFLADFASISSKSS